MRTIVFLAMIASTSAFAIDNTGDQGDKSARAGEAAANATVLKHYDPIPPTKTGEDQVKQALQNAGRAQAARDQAARANAAKQESARAAIEDHPPGRRRTLRWERRFIHVSVQANLMRPTFPACRRPNDVLA